MLDTAIAPLVKALCIYPAECEWRSYEIPPRLLVEMRAHGTDHGKVLGQGGRNLRTIALLANRLTNDLTTIRLLDPLVGAPAKSEFKFDPNWNPERILELLDPLLVVLGGGSVNYSFRCEEDCFTAYVGESEPPAIIDGVAYLFKCIGKVQGREVRVSLFANGMVWDPYDTSGNPGNPATWK